MGFLILVVLSLLALAAKIQAQCAQDGKCPATPEVSGDPPARPGHLEYRLDPEGTRFIAGYKGAPDPDCGYVITGGVEWLPAKQLFCESAEELRWEGTGGARQTVPVAARAGEAWIELRRMFPIQVGLR